jgi:ribosomal protein S18 acetylase RimI-like enzyme
VSQSGLLLASRDTDRRSGQNGHPSRTRFDIKKVRLTDTKSLSRLECKCYDYPWHPYANWFWKRASDYMYAYKAVASGKIVGGIVALPTRLGCIYVYTLFVDEGHRGNGIGEALLNRVLSQKNGSRIKLDTWSYNREAKGLFSKLGFKVKRRLTNYYEEGIDYLLLER